MFHAFLFNIRNYSHEVINIQRHEAELTILVFLFIYFSEIY